MNILKRIFKKRITNKITNSNTLCFNDWCKELIYYKTSVSWIDKYGTKHSLWSKKPTINTNGELVQINDKEKQIEYYRWLLTNRIDLLTITC
jgi:hypothetical protein